MILAGILALPLLACAVIVIGDPGVKLKLLIDLILHALVFIVITAGMFYYFTRNETHEDHQA